jgi:hypothetical protein
MSVRGLSDGPVHHVPIHRMAIDVGWVIVTASLAGAACGDARGGGGAEVDGAGGSGGHGGLRRWGHCRERGGRVSRP